MDRLHIGRQHPIFVHVDVDEEVFGEVVHETWRGDRVGMDDVVEAQEFEDIRRGHLNGLDVLHELLVMLLELRVHQVKLCDSDASPMLEKGGDVGHVGLRDPREDSDAGGAERGHRTVVDGVVAEAQVRVRTRVQNRLQRFGLGPGPGLALGACACACACACCAGVRARRCLGMSLDLDFLGLDCLPEERERRFFLLPLLRGVGVEQVVGLVSCLGCLLLKSW
mmetsp:Transcript_37532/g.79606  ORF Transcript_37532/g.79606 Transcript_37532/m.79606 type:complete len:223 (-) Transcript_37532:125-793(-)